MFALWAVSLNYTSRYPLLQMCRWHMKAGADPKANTDEGDTVVVWAAWAGGLEVTRYATAVKASFCSGGPARHTADLLQLFAARYPC